MVQREPAGNARLYVGDISTSHIHASYCTPVSLKGTRTKQATGSGGDGNVQASTGQRQIMLCGYQIQSRHTALVYSEKSRFWPNGVNAALFNTANLRCSVSQPNPVSVFEETSVWYLSHCHNVTVFFFCS